MNSEFTLLEDVSDVPSPSREYNNNVPSMNPYFAPRAIRQTRGPNMMMENPEGPPGIQNDPRADPHYQAYLAKMQEEQRRLREEQNNKIDCTKALSHMDSCKICSAYTKCNDKYYWVIIAMLAFVIISMSVRKRK